MSSSRIPHLLEPYMGLPPEAALVVLTGVLGASTNWLILRCAYSLLLSRQSAAEQVEEADAARGGTDVAVVLVSFMRDRAFWREGASKMGFDLDTLDRAGRFTFVDGLTGLFAAPSCSDARKEAPLRSPALVDVRRAIEVAMAKVNATKTVLIVDQVDALLAAAGPSAGVTSLSLQNMLLSLREHVHACILTLAADEPLLHTQNTSLEREHAALVLSQAHAAQTVLALRRLDTGAAPDVSGVVRITARGDGAAADGCDVEYLYYVAADGGVRVFERGT
ncbi:hypothetical protein DCS_00906 [Drechmeria coniospora]|uniref:Elongator complex protein 6 n=1 Tax=Drechmeria coniospora TaxID=98403 RepID=A0A151GRY5_DRECN|nr:hypothetical protein DCS_00906 [Drechmeria coniospora]KYK59772.1 hypothetical protein DCS_00906 [Drechmeria coniospora]